MVGPRRAALILTALAACTPSGSPSEPTAGTSSGPTVTSTRAAAAATHYAEVLALMRLDPQDLTRAQRLYPLIEPLCRDGAARRDFIAQARQAASAPSDLGKIERYYALDILEHVAVACARGDVSSSTTVLAEAGAAFPDEPRIGTIEARILAADGQWAEAAAAAERAVAGGSVGALALLATIQAQQAKATASSTTPPARLLDRALETVSVEPDGAWRLVDLMAVLQTRARLLTERAAWEDGAARVLTATAARGVYERLGMPPFIEATRQHALDVLCFDAVETGADDGALDACARAGAEHGNLGGAFLAGLGLDPKRYDLERVQAFQAIEARVAEQPAGAWVLFIARGDESELVAWARPAAVVLSRLVERRAQIVVIDRTRGARAGALLDRIVRLAGAAPVLRLDAERDTLATGCAAALVAGREAPAGCPLAPEARALLARSKAFGLGVLVGRDLDAEIDDLELYTLPEILLSMRQPATDKRVDLQLKSLSDVWLLAPRAASRAGSQPPHRRVR
jgi:hypothetical protein